MKQPGVEVVPRIRVMSGEDIALGPGKADLLEAIEREGTLGQAASTLAMSYMRAWKLVRTMNACFREPLVELARGGATRGSATLTKGGRDVLALYRRMEAASRRAMAAPRRDLARRMR